MNPNLSDHKFLVVGDVHSCGDELIELIKISKISPTDTLIFTGNVWNNGNKPEKTLEILLGHPNTFVTLGGSDIDILKAGVQQEVPTLLHSRLTLEKVGSDLFYQMADFLEKQPACIETPYFQVVHTRIDPRKSLQDQEIRVLCAYPPENAKKKELEKELQQELIRECKRINKELSSERLREIDAFKWYEFCPRGLPLIIGNYNHVTSASRVDMKCLDYTNRLGKRIIGLETDPHNENFLSGVLFSADYPNGKFIFVPAKGNYNPEAVNQINLHRWVAKTENIAEIIDFMKCKIRKKVIFLNGEGREIIPVSRSGLELSRVQKGGEMHLPSRNYDLQLNH